MADNETRRLLLAAGGTGGHIWPAISFGRWINARHPECEVKYICGSRPLEREIYREAGENPVVLNLEGSPLSGGVLQRSKRLLSLFSAYNRAFTEISSFNPDAALLFGGYLSFPVILACRRAHVRCAMHEQNARAGKVTRIAAKMGLRIYSGWSECLPLQGEKHRRTGVPVRNFELLAPEEAWRKLALSDKMPEGPRVVVFTGSLGSQSVKDKICETADLPKFRGWNFILPAVSEKPQREANNVWLLPKVWDASLLYAIADMLVLRAGGSTLTEAGVLGIPSLIIPWKGAADNHQYYNAQSFISENAGLIWTGDTGDETLASALLKLKAISRTKSGEGLYGRGNDICENLWSALWSD